MEIDSSRWSGEGSFTGNLIAHLRGMETITHIRVEDAPASRAEADYNFICNEVFVRFASGGREQRGRRFGILPVVRAVAEKSMTMAGLEEVLTALPDVGAPDYADEGMLQYLRAERIVAPYQTRGYKLVELVRIYEAGSTPRF